MPSRARAFEILFSVALAEVKHVILIPRHVLSSKKADLRKLALQPPRWVFPASFEFFLDEP